MASFESAEHAAQVKAALRELVTNESYWNVILFCRDGAVAHNRLIIGLLFPVLSDEISVICPDHSVQDIADLVAGILDTGPASEAGEVTAEVGGACAELRSRLVVSHVLDTDTHVFHHTQGSAGLGQEQDTGEDIALSHNDLSTEADLACDSQDPLLMDAADPCPDDMRSDPLLLSSCEYDTKSNISLLTDIATPKKSPAKKSPFKRIKLKRRLPRTPVHNTGTNLNPIMEDNKQAVVDELEIKGIMSDLLDRIEKEESQPKNLVFSTLGMSSETELIEDEDQDNDNISSYLESSPEPSPSPEPEPFYENFCDVNAVGEDNVNVSDDKEDGIAVNSFYSQQTSFLDNFEENWKKFKLRGCNVDIERIKLDDKDKDDIDFYLKTKELKVLKNTKRYISRKKKFFRRKASQQVRNDPEDTRNRRLLIAKKLRKSKRCFECEACLKPDCRKCAMCKDMKKYGGKGLKKQSCMTRPTCLFLENNKAASLKGLIRKKKLISKSVHLAENKDKVPASTSENKKKASQTLIKANSMKTKLLKKKHPDAKKKLNAQSNFSNNVRHKLQKYETVNSKDVLIRKNKIQEIKEKFRQQEEKALSGKVSIENFSKEELLFGFYL